MPRKKVTFVKAEEEIKEGKFKGWKKAGKSKKMSEKRAQKKQAKGQGFISKAYGGNPIEMSPYKMESNKQEKYNLMHDNPVAKHASGGSWMSKHSNSALHMGHSPMHKIDPPVNIEKNTKRIPSSLDNLDGYIKDTDSPELADMKRKQAALNELRRQKGHYGPDTPSAMDNLDGYIKDTDSPELADMKRKQAALNEIRRQKGHYDKN